MFLPWNEIKWIGMLERNNFLIYRSLTARFYSYRNVIYHFSKIKKVRIVIVIPFHFGRAKTLHFNVNKLRRQLQ